MGAGDAIKLAATGADAKIEDGAPQPFQSAFQAGGMNYVGGANSHALTAFETATEKIRFCQRARRANYRRLPVGPY